MTPDPIPGWVPLDLAQQALVALQAARLHLVVLAALAAAGIALLRWPSPAAALGMALAAGGLGLGLATGWGVGTGLGPVWRAAQAPPAEGRAAAPGLSAAAAICAPERGVEEGVENGVENGVEGGGENGGPIDITLVSANIRRGNPRMEEALAALAALSPDVTVLIEADARPGGPLAAALDMPAAAPLGDPVLARYPWISVTALSPHPARLSPRILFFRRMPARSAVDVQIAPGRMLRVVGVHFASPFLQSHVNQRAGHAQFGQIAADPLVAVGDFNAPPWAPELAEIAGALRARQVGGWRPSWLPGAGAAARALRPWLGLAIDHMMVTPSVEVLSIRMVPVPGSDHLAQVARLRLHSPASPTERAAADSAPDAGPDAGPGG